VFGLYQLCVLKALLINTSRTEEMFLAEQ